MKTIALILFLVTQMDTAHCEWEITRFPRHDFERDTMWVDTLALVIDGRDYWRMLHADG